jgi:hypothetical protein
MQYVVKIEDPVEQLEVARAVAESFKVPESAIFERLKRTPRRPEVRPVARTAAPVQSGRRLTMAEKQLIQALVQGRNIGEALKAVLQSEFGDQIWSRAVLQELVKDPARSIEIALETVQDEELKKEVRAAVLEPFGPISNDQALDSVKRLYDGHLVQKLEETRLLLKKYGSGPAPAELVRRHMDIVAERTRVAGFKA